MRRVLFPNALEPKIPKPVEVIAVLIERRVGRDQVIGQRNVAAVRHERLAPPIIRKSFPN